MRKDFVTRPFIGCVNDLATASFLRMKVPTVLFDQPKHISHFHTHRMPRVELPLTPLQLLPQHIEEHLIRRPH
jgi:hypothetical protein